MQNEASHITGNLGEEMTAPGPRISAISISQNPILQTLNAAPTLFCLILLLVGLSLPAPAQQAALDANVRFSPGLEPKTTFTTLVDFDGTDGDTPDAGLIQGTDGNFYGVTNQSGEYGGGTIFQITPAGVLTTLYSFCALTNCTVGANQQAPLLLATDGNYYGTTTSGGKYGDGTVFKLENGTWVLTTLYSFCKKSNCSDGSSPVAGLVQGTAGDLYGTTYSGGKYSGGTVFKITTKGTLTTVYSFCSTQTDGLCTDGGNPKGGVVQGANGDFYGTTVNGGVTNNRGTVFEVTSAGTLTQLWDFCQTDCSDGESPDSGLILATDGNFYGTTSLVGANDGGAIFQITPAGVLAPIYGFCAEKNCTDGNQPVASLIQGTDGNFYGSTLLGGKVADDDGTIFKLKYQTSTSTYWKLTTEAEFDGTDGASPQGALMQATNGTFYGTNSDGGTGGNIAGTVFSLSVGLGAFVETIPTSGKVKAAVTILGTDLTGATSVTFNGTAATFDVVSSSKITTTVPTGATTGTVEVKTPSGTLKSNVVFTVN